MLSVQDRLSTKFTVSSDGCWLWTGSIHRTGYGRINIGGRSKEAHIVAYEEHVGPVPAGLVLDHTCHDPKVCAGGWSCIHRRCINPAHLEPVTQAENNRRGSGKKGVDPEKVRARQARWRSKRVICPVCGTEGARQHQARHSRRHLVGS